MDFVEPKDIRPDLPGLEILMGPESHGGRLFLFKCDGSLNGSLIWDNANQIDQYDQDNRHAHYGWAANMRDDMDGLECFAIFRKVGTDELNYPYYLFNMNGTRLERGDLDKPAYSQPIDWDGDNVMEMHDGVMLYSLNPPIPGKKYVFVADVIGDYREEILIFRGGYNDSPLTGEFYVYTNTTLNTQRKQSPWSNRLYSESKKRTGYRD